MTPLTDAMDNVLAWRLGEVAHKAVEAHSCDLIDRGLILRRLLEESGFAVCVLAQRTAE